MKSLASSSRVSWSPTRMRASAKSRIGEEEGRGSSATGTKEELSPIFTVFMRPRAANNSAARIGLVRYSSAPAARHLSRSPFMACAVSAMIGKCRPEICSLARTARMACSPSMTGICTSISTRSGLSRSMALSASWPFSTTLTVLPCFSSSFLARSRLTALSSASKIFNASLFSSTGSWATISLARFGFTFVSSSKSASKSSEGCTGFIRQVAIARSRWRPRSPGCEPELSIRMGM